MDDEVIKMNPNMALSVLSCLLASGHVPSLSHQVLDALLDAQQNVLDLTPERIEALKNAMASADDKAVEADALRLGEYLRGVIREGEIL